VYYTSLFIQLYQPSTLMAGIYYYIDQGMIPIYMSLNKITQGSVQCHILMFFLETCWMTSMKVYLLYSIQHTKLPIYKNIIL